MQYRQGDLLLIQIPATTAGEVLPHRILAEGEKTGHCHQLQEGELLLAGRDLFARLSREAVLVHPEHHPLRLPPGHYRVVRQREYTPRENHRVFD